MGVRTIMSRYHKEPAITDVTESASTKQQANTNTEQEPDASVDQPEDVDEKPDNQAAINEDTALNEHEINIDKIIDSETGYVDYEKTNFRPTKRRANQRWKDSIYSEIENVVDPANAPVNTYLLKRVNVTLSDQTTATYKAYINPETGLIEKITEIVNCGEDTEIYDYYYYKGNINYIDNYRTRIDKPITISSGDIESRYYFGNDMLVRFIYCTDGKATEYSLSDLSSYSEGTVAQYDFLEKEMINRAYDVYNLAKSIDEAELLSGYVLDEYLVPLDDASVEIVSDGDGKVIATTQTDGDGFYKVLVPVTDKDTYTVKIDKDTLEGVSVYGITALPGSGSYSVDPVYLGYKNNAAVVNVQIMTRDATDYTKGLSGGTIKLRRGINDTQGDVIATGTLDDTGSVIVPMTPGCYTAEVAKGGYETALFTVVVRIDHLATVGFAVPDVGEDEISMILSWESTPLDLDIRAIASLQNRVIKSSIDSVGATMAEVVDIKDVGTDDYRIYVSDYSGMTSQDYMSYNMTNSGAVVTVYDSNGYLGRYHVPVANAGICWEALEVHNKMILPINTYYYTSDGDELWLRK